MELLIPSRALSYRLSLLRRVEHVTLKDAENKPLEESDILAGYINYEGVSIHWKYHKESSKLSFIIVTRQSHIPAIHVKEQILKWFG